MPTAAIDYNIINRGVYRIATRVVNEDYNYNFLQSVLFGLPSVGTKDDFIVFDYKKIGVRISDEAIKGLDPNRVNYGQDFKEEMIYGQYFFDEDSIGYEEAENRVWGEPIDKPWSVQERLMNICANKRDEMKAVHRMNLEKLCADLLFAGKFTTKAHGEQVFPISNDLLNITGTGFSTDPLKVFAKAIAEVHKHGGMPTAIILNPDNALTLLSNDKFCKMLDNRRIEGNNIEVGPIQSNGLEYLGIVSIPGGSRIEVYTYYGRYVTKDGSSSPYYIKENNALVVPRRIGFIGYTGLLVNNGIYQGKQALKDYTYVYGKSNGVLVRTFIQEQTAPAPIITAIDKYGVITGLNA